MKKIITAIFVFAVACSVHAHEMHVNWTAPTYWADEAKTPLAPGSIQSYKIYEDGKLVLTVAGTELAAKFTFSMPPSGCFNHAYTLTATARNTSGVDIESAHTASSVVMLCRPMPPAMKAAITFTWLP